MKNFMSSVYVKPNPVSDEKVCVGLFVGSAGSAHFALAANKLKVVNHLVPHEVYSSLKKSLESLEKTIHEKLKTAPNIMFSDKIFTPDYFTYLNKYNKGLISFSEPSTIGKGISDDEFAKLFELYVGEPLHKPDVPETKRTLKKIVGEYLKRDVFKEKADLNYVIDNSVISSVYTERTIDFISCNGNIFAGKAIDFNAEPRTIENHLFEYRALVEGLREFAKRKNLAGVPKFVAYYNAPETADTKELLHRAEKDSNKHFNLAEVGELDKAASTLSEHSYRKFSELV